MMNLRFLLVTVLALFLTGCSRQAASRSESSQTIPSQIEFALSTICQITLYDWGEPRIYQDIFSRIKEIESRMSLYLEGSELDQINRAAGIEAVRVSADLFEVIERAVHYAELSGGAFDPTVGPLVTLWDIGGDNPRVPTQEEIDAVLPLVNWRNIELNRENQTVFLTQPGMALDLGAIAKGYAGDEAAAIIKKARVPQAIVNLGGNTLAVGEKLDGTPWRVGIQNPLEGRGAYIGIVQTDEISIVTSGLYERYYVADDGTHYHHLILPSSGYPAQSGLLAVSILTDISMDADALSTAVFVLGFDEGRALVESLDGVEAIFVLEDRTVRLTDGINFTLTDDHFTLVID